MSFSKALKVVSRSLKSNNRCNSEAPRRTRKLRLEALESRELLAGYNGAENDAELASQIFVTTLVDVKDENDGHISLREALENVTSDNYTITFADELIGGTITLNSNNGALNITKRVTIDAWNLHTTEQHMPVKAFAGIKIDGAALNYAAAGGTPMVQVESDGDAFTATLRGLTFKNSATDATMKTAINDDRDGVAVYASGSVYLTVQNCVFTDLKYGSGGVVDFYGTRLILANSLIADNTALHSNDPNSHRDSAILVGGSASAFIHNCTVVKNSAKNSSGSETGSHGLYRSSHATVEVHNSIFTHHTCSAFWSTTGTTFKVKNSVVEKGNSNVTVSGNSLYDSTSSEPLYVDAANGKYWLAKNSLAINRGGKEYFDASYGYIITPEDNKQGYDLAGNYRRRVSGISYYIDAGAYAALVPSVTVTLENDVVNADDDFFADGKPNQISLREAYNYVNTVYLGGNFRAPSFANVASGSNYNTIQFAANVSQCVLNSQIVSEKTYTIKGKNPNNVNVTVRGSAANNFVNPDAARIFYVKSKTITANNLNLANAAARSADAEYASANGKGGAIYIADNAGYVANGGKFSYNYASAAGGAVFVAQDGAFTGTGVVFEHNESVRGGGVANFGTASVLGASQFTSNKAGDAATKGFGGAAYNAGTMKFGKSDEPTHVTTFNANAATSATPAAGAQLLGGSGGAIYNTSQVGKTVSLSVYHSVFNGNTASKYGGAIANFSSLTVQDSDFASNASSSGGAIQTSGTAALADVEFSNNSAAVRSNPLVVNSGYGIDYGGNGGAIFASGRDAGVTLQGVANFDRNTAENAGGAIDYINGSLTFNAANVTFNKNHAVVIGGAIVAAREIGGLLTSGSTFNFGDGVHATDNTAGNYAPNVAVVCGARDQAINDMELAFFGMDDPGRDKLDTFTRYSELTAENHLTFEALAQSFPTPPTVINYKVDDDVDYTPLTSNGAIDLELGSHIVYYYADSEADVVFRMNVLAASAATSVVLTQIDLGGQAYIGPNEYAVGISISVYSADPIVSWTIDWNDGSDADVVYEFGFACSAYHVYNAPGERYVSLTTGDSAGNVETYTNLGYCVVEDIYGSPALLDELFVEF